MTTCVALRVEAQLVKTSQVMLVPLFSIGRCIGHDSCFPKTSLDQGTRVYCAPALLTSQLQKSLDQVLESLPSCCSHCLLIRLESGKCRLDDHALQIWESEFAWTEADKPVKLAARALTVPEGSSLNQQPMFCFETMMTMWYWSCLVYDYQRVRLPYIHTHSSPKLVQPLVSANSAALAFQLVCSWVLSHALLP